MLKQILAAFVLFVSLDSFAQKKNVIIKIIQDKKVFEITSSPEVIQLDKRPFVIEVTLKKMDGVYLYAGFSDSIYRLNNDEPIPDYANLPAMSMAETSFNADREMIISKDGWAYWFYDNSIDWHRFDKNISIRKKGNLVVGTKTVQQFYFPFNESTLKIESVSAPLYLFFLAVATYDSNKKPGKELSRKKVQIKWHEQGMK